MAFSPPKPSKTPVWRFSWAVATYGPSAPRLTVDPPAPGSAGPPGTFDQVSTATSFRPAPVTPNVPYRRKLGLISLPARPKSDQPVVLSACRVTITDVIGVRSVAGI